MLAEVIEETFLMDLGTQGKYFSPEGRALVLKLPFTKVSGSVRDAWKDDIPVSFLYSQSALLL